jgi:replicative DNA helicase
MRTRAIDVGGRTPPNDEGLEEAVLSAMMLSRDAIDDVRSTGLLANEFYGDARKRICEVIFSIADRDEPVDIKTITRELERREARIAVGGIAYLVHVIDATPSLAHVAAHAKILRDLARRRAFIESLQLAQGEAWMHKGSTDEMIADSLARLDGVADLGVPALTIAFDAVTSRWRSLEAQWSGERAPTGIPSKLPLLQPLLGGYRPSALSVLAGSTGGGKSSAGLQEALDIAGAIHNGETIGVVVISLEMDCDENIDRAIAIESGVPDAVIQTGARNNDEHNQLHAAAYRVSRKPLWFVTSEVDIHGIRSAWRRADREMRKHGPDRRVRFVIVDFLGLVKLDDAERHDIALSNLTRGLKMFAMSENIHVMALCQFNRGNAQRDPWDEPQLSDLKDSSGIEQNANQVIFVHRVLGIQGAEDYAGIVVRKNRKGQQGRVKTRFNGACYRFELPRETDIARWDAAREATRPARRRRK